MEGMVKNPPVLKISHVQDIANTLPFEEIFESGAFVFRLLWDWAKLPEDIRDCEICGLTCDEEGRVYATTRAPGRPIAVFAPDGSFERYIGEEIEVGHPHGISLTRSGDIWFTDDKYHVANLVSQDGCLLRRLGHFRHPSDSGVDLKVKSRLRFYTEKRLAPPFNRPTRIVEAADGRLFASDGYGNAAVHRFSADGQLEKTWGGMGSEPGHFGIVHSIVVDRRGRVIVSDREFDRIQIFDSNGTLLHVVGDLLYPYDVACLNGYSYVSEREGRITILNEDFEIAAQIGWCGGPFHGHSIAVDHKGNLFLGILGGQYHLIKLEKIDGVPYA